MSKKSITMLVLSIVFVTLALVALVFDGVITFGTLDFLNGGVQQEGLGGVIAIFAGGILMLAMCFLFLIAVIALASIALPFSIISLKSCGKKWYAIVILVINILIYLTAILFFTLLLTNNSNGGSSSSSSSASESIKSAAALLLPLL